ncbi:MAG: PHP domain-containing protein [Bacilli bacterium]
MNKINYHNHTYLCKHAIGEPKDYVNKAVENHYTEIGISDHGPLVPGWGLRMTLEQFYNVYLPQIDEAIAVYGNKIQIFKGLEIEYLENYEEFYQNLLLKLDYLILGQHVCYFKNKIHDIYHFMNEETLESYKDLVIKGMASGNFKILAHPDVFMYKHKFWDSKAQEISQQIIEAAIKYHVLLELNVNGIRRGPIITENNEITYIYPRIEFWRLVSQYPNALTIIGEDNHEPSLTNDEACEVAREMAERLGIKPITKFLGA